MVEISNDDNAREITLYANPAIYHITKNPIGAHEAGALVSDCLAHRPKDVVAQTNSSTKFLKTFSSPLPTSFIVNEMQIPSTRDLFKYQHQKFFYFHETPEFYRRNIVPFVQNLPPATNGWIDDFVSGRQSVLLNEKTFVLVPDVKWDTKDKQMFYGLVFLKDTSITCVRDLRQRHIHLLTAIRESVLGFIRSFSALEEDEVVVYIHYYPSFWRFHIHFTSIYFSTLSRNNHIGKAIDLDTVIANLTASDTYYETATLLVSVGSVGPFFPMFKNNPNQ